MNQIITLITKTIEELTQRTTEKHRVSQRKSKEKSINRRGRRVPIAIGIRRGR